MRALWLTSSAVNFVTIFINGVILATVSLFFLIAGVRLLRVLSTMKKQSNAIVVKMRSVSSPGDGPFLTPSPSNSSPRNSSDIGNLERGLRRHSSTINREAYQAGRRSSLKRVCLCGVHNEQVLRSPSLEPYFSFLII